MTGNEIKRLRAALQLTLPGFAKLVRVSVPTLRRWEFHGEREVLLAGATRSILKAVADTVAQSEGVQSGVPASAGADTAEFEGSESSDAGDSDSSDIGMPQLSAKR